MSGRQNRFCSIPGCENRHEAKGFCEGHYTRWRKYGVLMDRGPCALSKKRVAVPAARRPTKKSPLTIEELHEYLSYCPETGILKWRINRGHAVVGDIVSSRDNKGYVFAKINGNQHYAHRLAWAHVNGEWPSNQIDHINGDKADNRIANLRPATQSQNLGNRGPMKTSRTGLRGVKLVASGRFVAIIAKGQKKFHLGTFDTAEAAARAYDAAALLQYGDFAYQNFPIAARALTVKQEADDE